MVAARRPRRELVAFDQRDARPSAGQLVGASASDDAAAHDDGVVRLPHATWGELAAISTHVRVVPVHNHIAIRFEACHAFDRERPLPIRFPQHDQVAWPRPWPLEHEQPVARLENGPHTCVFDHEPAQRQQSAHPLGVNWTTLPRPVRWTHRSGT